jgi:5,5'-dehydrodivanillate O-demethylase
VLFPNTLRVGQGRSFSFQIRVPMDDTHTHHFVYRVRVPNPGEVLPEQGPIRVDFENVYKPNGRIRADWVLGQDQSAWIIQGPITDRTDEHLGATDVGIILYRKLINEQLKIMEDGGDPINVHRTDKGPIFLQQEHSFYPGYTETGGPFRDMPVTAPDVEMELAEKISADFA